MKFFSALLGLSVLTMLTGCASVISGTNQKIAVTSTPPGARISVVDWNGQTIQNVNAPATLNLKRGKGYFAGASYKVKLEADGYQPSETTLSSNMNGWYAGNVVLGGLIGLCFVDPATGAMWSLKPNKLDVVLKPNTVAANEVSKATSP